MATILAVQAEAFFDLQHVLSEHCWCPDMITWAAEAALKDENPYTYLLRPNEQESVYVLSFVLPSGEIQHDEFVVINGRLGIFLNGAPDHCGPLGKVLLDMMGCAKGEETPLWS